MQRMLTIHLVQNEKVEAAPNLTVFAIRTLNEDATLALHCTAGRLGPRYSHQLEFGQWFIALLVDSR